MVVSFSKMESPSSCCKMAACCAPLSCSSLVFPLGGVCEPYSEMVDSAFVLLSPGGVSGFPPNVASPSVCSVCFVGLLAANRGSGPRLGSGIAGRFGVSGPGRLRVRGALGPGRRRVRGALGPVGGACGPGRRRVRGALGPGRRRVGTSGGVLAGSPVGRCVQRLRCRAWWLCREASGSRRRFGFTGGWPGG